MSFSSMMSSIGQSVSGLTTTIGSFSPKTKAAVVLGGLAVGLTLGYLAYSGSSEPKPLTAKSVEVEKAVGEVSREKVVLPSDLFKARVSRSDGTTAYEKSEVLTGMLKEGEMSIGDIAKVMQGMKLKPAEMVQVLALTKANFPNDERLPSDSPFNKLNDMQNALAKLLPKSSSARAQVASPKEVSLAEGELPKINVEYKAKLIQYMQGSLPASELKITEENCGEVLQAVKVLDLELDRKVGSRRGFGLKFSSYELRTRCLVASKGKMPSFEAYTKSVDPKYFENPFSSVSREYASHEENYVPERVGLHAQLTMKYLSDMSGLSKRFNNEEPTMYALSGNTAVGKSFMAKSDEEFMRGVDESGEATGALNPDTMKALLRKDVDGVTNQQIHIEGFAMNRKLADELHGKALQTSMVIDERLGTVSGTKDLIATAERTGKKLVIKDIDAPLAVSALRVLGRDVRKDPCVPFGPIAGGYKSIRAQRAAVIDLVVKSPQVKSYELSVMDESGRSGVAARKIPATKTEPATLEIVDKELFDYALSGQEKAERDIEALKTARVDSSLYGKYAGKGVKTESLKPFVGCSMEAALEQHSLALPKWQSVSV